jgi:cadherin 5 type 2 (VE-cadherin)
MYTIIVAEDDSKNASGLEMPSWRDVQAYSVWPPYQVTGICIAAFLNQCL